MGVSGGPAQFAGFRGRFNPSEVIWAPNRAAGALNEAVYVPDAFIFETD
jgi:hypothetical protein